MTTLAHAELKRGAAIWEDCYSSAVFAGIIGDPAHQARGGYHISIEDQSSSNYSVVRPDDKAPPGTWPRNQAAAIDMSMSQVDMKTDYIRMLAVWSDKEDPRRQFLNAYNGWNGIGDAKRLDFYNSTSGTATSDHKWHGHEERRRRYVADSFATNAIGSIHRGLTKSQWLAEAMGGQVSLTCLYGQTGDNVWILQLQMLDVDPTAMGLMPNGTPRPADGRYGDATASGVVKLGLTANGADKTGKTYGPSEYVILQRLFVKKWAPVASGGLVPHRHDLPTQTGTVAIPASMASVSLPGGETGDAKQI